MDETSSTGQGVEEYYRTADICRLIKRDPSSLYNYVRAGLVTPRRVRGRFMWTKADLMRLVGDNG